MQYRSNDFRETLTFKLIVALVVIFLLQAILIVYVKIDLSELFGLSRDGLAGGRIWQLLTFQFLHAAPWPWHVLFNCIALYFFARPLEETQGAKRVAQLYLLGGVLGGLFELGVSFLPQHSSGAVVGASAGIMALIAAWITLNPWHEVCFFFYFFPVKLKASIILWILIFMSVFGVIVPYSNTANGAHLAGLITGIAFARYIFLAGDDGPLARYFPTREGGMRRRRPSWLSSAFSRQPASPKNAKAQAGDFVSTEVDPILDKISAHGIHSLTAEERAILEQAQKRMAKR